MLDQKPALHVRQCRSINHQHRSSFGQHNFTSHQRRSEYHQPTSLGSQHMSRFYQHMPQINHCKLLLSIARRYPSPASSEYPSLRVLSVREESTLSIRCIAKTHPHTSAYYQEQPIYLGMDLAISHSCGGFTSSSDENFQGHHHEQSLS